MPKRSSKRIAALKVYLVRVASMIGGLLVVLLAAQPALAANPSTAQKQDAERRYLLEPGVFVYGTSYVAPLAELFGEIYIGDNNFVAANSILRAAPTRQIVIGSGSNIQDNVLVRALEDSITIGSDTSLTHHAIVRNSQIGSRVYVGYRASVADSRVGDGAVIWHGAIVEGVNIPGNAFVAAGRVVTSQAQADALPKAAESEQAFARQQIQDTQGFTRGYINLYKSAGYEAIIGIGPNPKTSILPQSVMPRVAETAEMEEFVRIVGDVRVGGNSTIGQRTTMRADEGSPIIVGADADIDDRVTIHGLEDTAVRIGEHVTVDDDALIHGPADIGDNVTVGERSVVFNATVEDNVIIGQNAIITPPPGQDSPIVIPANSVVPEDAVITGPNDLGKLRQGGGTGNNGEDQDDVPGELPETGAGGLAMGRAATAGAAAAYTADSAKRR